MKENLIISLVDADPHLVFLEDTEQMGIELTHPAGGTSDYDDLKNKPSLNGVTLQGALSFSDIGLPENIANAAT